MSAPLLWGPNNTSNNLQNAILTASGMLLDSNGPKNLITYNNFENGLTTGWSTGLVGPNGSIVNGLPTSTPTFNTAAAFTLSATTSNPIEGLYSLRLYAPSVATSRSMFATDAINVPLEYRAKVLTWRFAYNLVTDSGANFSGTSSNTFGVAVYDVTNSQWLGTAGQFNLVQKTGVGICTGTFQTNSTTAVLRFVVYIINTTGTPLEVTFDDFYLGPQPTAQAPAMSDWQSYTPSFVGFSGSNISFFWRRSGQNLEIQGRCTVNSPTATIAQISLPSGLVTDSTTVSTIRPSGYWERSNALNVERFCLITGGLNYFNLGDANQGNTTPRLASDLILNGEVLSISNLVIPIAGWSSNTISSADTDTRVIAAKVRGVTQGVVTTTWTQLNFGTVELDTAGIISSNTFVVPVSGIYQLSVTATFDAAADFYTGYTVNDANLANCNFNRIGAGTNFTAAGSALTAQLKAGDVIRLGIYNGSPFRTNTTISAYSIQRISGPAVVQATETVAAKYYATTFSGTTGIVICTTKVIDTHNAYNTSTGVFTVPVSGTYLVSGFLQSAGTSFAVNGYFEAYASQNGSATSNVNILGGSRAETTSALNRYAGGATELKCVAGDTVSLYINSSASTAPVTAQFNIIRVGN